MCRSCWWACDAPDARQRCPRWNTSHFRIGTSKTIIGAKFSHQIIYAQPGCPYLDTNITGNTPRIFRLCSAPTTPCSHPPNRPPSEARCNRIFWIFVLWRCVRFPLRITLCCSVRGRGSTGWRRSAQSGSSCEKWPELEYWVGGQWWPALKTHFLIKCLRFWALHQQKWLIALPASM